MFFDGGYLGLSVQGTAQNYGSPAEDEVGIQMRSSRTRFEGAAKNWTWHLVQSDYQHQELTAGAVGTTFKNKGLDGKLEWQQGSEQGLTKLGFGQTRNRFVADGVEAFVPKTFSQSQALYALQEMKLSQATVSMAWRGELSDVNSLGSDSAARFVAAGRHFAASNLALGAVLPLTANVSVTADAARGARAPKDYELYADGEHVATKSYEVGNSKLGVEQSKHSELGLRWQSGRADSARLAVFQTSYDNFIIASPTGASSTAGNPIYQYGAVPARLTGWELTANQRAVSWMDVQARMSSVQGRNLATAEPLPRMAPLRIGLDATSKTNWRGMPVTFKLGFDHSAAQNLVPTNQTSVASYTLWNAAMTLEQKMQTHRALWFARLDNITNSLAYPATSILTQTAPGRVPLPGRNAQLGVQVSF